MMNSNPGGYVKRTLTGGIKFILTSVFEGGGGVGTGHTCVDFFSMNYYGLWTMVRVGGQYYLHATLNASAQYPKI